MVLMTRPRTLISSHEEEWQGLAQMHVALHKLVSDVRAKMHLRLQRERVKAVKKVLYQYSKCCYPLMIITATDSLRYHHQHSHLYLSCLLKSIFLLLFLTELWHGRSEDGDKLVLGCIHTRHVCRGSVEFQRKEDFSSFGEDAFTTICLLID